MVSDLQLYPDLHNYPIRGLESEVVDDEQIKPRELGKIPLDGVGGPGRVELDEHLGHGGEQNIVAFADRTVPQGLGKMALAGPAGADVQCRLFFLGDGN